MPFNNPIVAGEELIRSSIMSENFSVVEPGAGWRIGRDGAATFNSIDVRGNATGGSAAYDTVSAGTSLLYKGTELSSLFDTKGGRIVGYHSRITATPTAALNVYQAIARINFTAAANKTYRITATGALLASGGSGSMTWDVRLKYNYGVNPTFTSPDLRQSTPSGPSGGIPIPYQIGGLFRSATVQDVRILLCFFGAVGNATSFGSTASSILPTELIIEELTDALPLTGVNDDGSATPPKTYRTFDVQPFASRGYRASGANLGYDNQYMHGGDIGVDGNRRSWAWFDANAAGGGSGGSMNDMQSVLTADLDYFDLFLFYPHWYYTSGGTAFIGHHNSTSVTSTEQGGGVYGEITQGWEGRNIGKWISLKGSSIATAALAGTIEGICLGNTGSASLSHYGYAYGANGINGQRPGLRAGYYK